MGLPILFARKKKFNPRQLFAAGEQGVWYDPSDFSTLFQDAAGTTPVTAIEQPVGLILDKSGRGNHASQSTTTSRPILRNLYNLLQYTEQFDNAYWFALNMLVFGSGSVANTTATTDPLGGNTADFVVPNTTNGVHRFNTPNGVIITTAKVILSCYVKAGGYSKVALIENQTTGAYATFDLSTGLNLASGGGTGTVSDISISSIGNDWYRIAIGVTPAASGGMRLDVFVASPTYTTGNPAVQPWIPNGTSGVYLWGASLVPANESSLPYQRVVTNTLGTGVYDTDLTKFPPYLFFDESDDWLETANINFSATDKMSVFAGVRKLSDSQQRIIAELSATIASNNGAFMLSAPNSAAANYNFSSKGTLQVDNTVTTYAAPITNVVTGLADISGPNNTIRINGAATPLTTSQGTGNYGSAYPLYIGRRFNTAATSFSGRLYSLLIRGTLTSSPQLEQTEKWVAGKTGVTL